MMDCLHTSSPALRNDSDYPARSQQWWSLAVLTLLIGVSYMDRHIIALLAQAVRVDLHISDFQIGLLQGIAFAGFYIVFGLILGRVVDRFPRRPIIFAGVCIWSVAAMASGMAQSFGQLFAARLALGAGEATLTPSAYSMLTDLFPGRRLATAISIFSSGATVGTFLSLLLGAGLIAVLPHDGWVLPVLGRTQPWRLVLLIMGVPGLLLALLTWTFPEPLRRGRRETGASTAGQAWRFMCERWRVYGAIILALGLIGIGASALGAWVSVYYMRKFGLSVSQTGVMVAFTSVPAAIIGTIATGALVDRWFASGRTDAHLRAIIFVAGIQIVAILLAFSTERLILSVAMICAAAACTGYAALAATALQIVTPSEYRGQVSALFVASFALIGPGLGPAMAGFLSSHIFHDDKMIGWGVAGTFVASAPIGILLIGSALRPMRLAVTQARAGWPSQLKPCRTDTRALGDAL
jgi:MFS family permease